MVKKSILGVDPNEIVIHEIKRHYIGLYFIYGVTAFLFTALIVGLFTIVRSTDTEVSLMAIGAVIALGVLILAIGYIAAIIYKTNELIVTNESLVQILQQSVFDRKVSQLNLSKVQDVTVDQEGLLPTVLGYGTLRIETAGEAQNYIFSYCPNPNINAKHVIEAHEQYMRNAKLSRGHGDGL